MAMIPRKVSSRSLNIGSGPQVIITDGGLGSAMEGAGDALNELGQQFVARRQKQEDFEAETAFQQMELEKEAHVRKASDNIQGNGAGFHDQVIGGKEFQEFDSKFIGNLPNRLKDRFQARLALKNKNWAIKTSEIESSHGRKWERQQISFGAEENLRRLAENPGDHQSIYEDIASQINSSTLSQIEKNELIAKWSDQHAIGRLDTLSPDQQVQVLKNRDSFAKVLPEKTRVRLLKGAQNEIEAAVRKQKAQARVEYSNGLNVLKDGIVRGVVDMQQIMDNEELAKPENLDDRATLIRQFQAKERQKKTDVQVESILSGDGALDIYSKSHRKALDNHYEQTIDAAPEDQKLEAAEAFIKKSNYVPDALVKDIRSSLASNDNEAALNALRLGSAALDVNPNAFAARSGSREIEKAVSHFDTYVRLGYSEDEALKRWKHSQEPEQLAKQQAVLKNPEVKKWVKSQSQPNDVAEVFDGDHLLRINPDFENEGQSFEAANEFKTILEHELISANGDREVALEEAKRQIAKSYGNTQFSINGSRTLVRHPFENFYPKVGASHQYAQSQLTKLIPEVTGKKPQKGKIFLSSDKETEKDIRAGKPPRYLVHFYDSTGVLQMLPGHFRPDMDLANKEFANSQKRKHQQNKAAKKALDQYFREYGFQN